MTRCADTSSGSFGAVLDSLPGPGQVLRPRLSLRKRKSTSERGSLCLPSVSSALLDGIFADVAEIQQAEGIEPSVGEIQSASADPPATKKSRSSLTHSISRSPKSFKCMGDVFFPSCNHFTPSSSVTDLTSQISAESKKRTIVSQLKVSECAANTPVEPSPSFPHLPAAVSVSSCNTLTRVLSDLQSSSPEHDGKDSYGWFIEMDNTEEKDPVDPYNMSAVSGSGNLAFVASTAPSAGNHDAEVEWAKAADTVDSVLGDFF